MADPYIARNPSISVGADELVSHARRLTLTPEDRYADVETFTNPGGEAPGSPVWSCEIEALQSFGTGSIWAALAPLARTKATLVIMPEEGVAVSPTNPSATCEVWVPTIPFIDSGVGESTTMTLTFKVVGEPTFAEA